ncbi:MAG TPA: sugar hydrolase [Myxococcales bacterium]|nr:sugar hydrolase [Myxococcales bacterium]
MKRHLGLVCFVGALLLLISIGCTSTPSPSDGGSKEESTPQLPQLVEGDVTQFVNPFIATGGAGFAVGSAHPGPNAPFGLVKVSPDTADKEGINFSHCAGYAYTDEYIVGFSHIHLYGTGVPDYGNLLFMPVASPIASDILSTKVQRSSYKKESEVAQTGYYKVHLDKPNTTVELTASTRTAYHRYTFKDKNTPHNVLIRLDHALPGGNVRDGHIHITSDKTFEGWLHSDGAMSKPGGGFMLYFVAKSKTPFQATTWKDDKIQLKELEQKGPKVGAFLTFPKDQTTVELQVGISMTGLAQAKQNLDKEGNNWDFEAQRQNTKQAWQDLLSRVRIAGGSQDQKTMFYTSLYHSYQMPTILSDTDGSYTGFDKKQHKAQGFTYYTDFSMWDTYRTLHPLLVLLLPKHQNDMVRSLLAMAKEGGYLPRWPLATGYTGTMVGASADIVIADTYIKGVRDFDAEAAYKAMTFLAMNPTPPGAKYGGRRDIEHYASKGYVQANKHSGAASVTMEFAYNDFAIAQMAKAMGKTKDVETYMKRSENYKHVWDDKMKFFRAKNADGTWFNDEFKDTVWTKDYVEGTAWQYLFFVPHDMDGLSTLFGGKDALLKRLDEFFELSFNEYEARERKLGLKKYYWHGNEPDLHVATMYILLGKPSLGQKWVRWIMDTRYENSPKGLAGNDDAGTLSAWYAFNAMGLYPIPGRDLYLITSPIFTRTQMTIEGKTIEIHALGASDKTKYVKKAWLNGKELPNLWLKHTELLKDGNVLRLELSDTP